MSTGVCVRLKVVPGGSMDFATIGCDIEDGRRSTQCAGSLVG